jgi:4-hydroxybenzoate polyprenyltransferase
MDETASMDLTSHQNRFTGVSRLKLFWALSRTPHGLLDMATPAFAALLQLGAFPPLHVIILGLVTTFAGYTAVYALNDVVDHRVDKEKLDCGGFCDTDDYLDAMLVRHPIAQGVLSFGEGLLWALSWGVVALIGAYILNPVCALIFLAGCVLEAFYCLMWRVSPFRTIVSGAVKTSGAVAGVFAVNPHPSFFYVFFLFLCLFFWEIGGQNIPADWTDIEEDKRLQAKTIPVRFGPESASVIALVSLVLAVFINVILFQFSQIHLKLLSTLISLGVGVYFLLIPGLRLYKTKDREGAMVLFNKASYYPLALLIVVVVMLMV